MTSRGTCQTMREGPHGRRGLLSLGGTWVVLLYRHLRVFGLGSISSRHNGASPMCPGYEWQPGNAAISHCLLTSH